MGIFKKRTGTKVKVLVEYELDYDVEIDKNNVSDLVDFRDIIKDHNNITAVHDVEFKAIRS